MPVCFSDKMSYFPYIRGGGCVLSDKYCVGFLCQLTDLYFPSWKYSHNLLSREECDQKLAEGACTPQCIGKPVIYLYPPSKMTVSVRLDSPGVVYISDPLYPKDGWQGVVAYPDGRLVYRGKDYPYLYYELAVDKPKISPKGIVMKKEELTSKLLEITGRLGLVRHEQKDFLEYWLPRLEKVNKPYIIFSLLDKSAKEKIDPVMVSPSPTTRIEFLVNFIPTDWPNSVESLTFEPVPQRVGLTMVEWGGSIISD